MKKFRRAAAWFRRFTDPAASRKESREGGPALAWQAAQAARAEGTR